MRKTQILMNSNSYKAQRLSKSQNNSQKLKY